jgi:hypothetical protein
MTFNPGDYTIEKLRYAKDFNIYPPVDASFKFETLDDDDLPNTLDDTIVQEIPRRPYYANRRPPKKPGDYHIIRGDFDNNPATDTTLKNFRSRPLRGGINGIPKKNRQPPQPPHFSRFDFSEPSNRPHPTDRDEGPHDDKTWNTLFRTLKNCSFKKK